jgi:hypothetical protein
VPTGLHLWSRTAASNATADSSINWAEGQSPSSVNDSARAMMARIAEWRDDIGGLTTGGSATSYSVSSNRGFASAAAMDKAVLTIIPHVTNGAAPSLAVDGLTARQLRTATGVNVPAGALIAGTPYMLIYLNATTEFILIGAIAPLGSLDVTGATALTAPDVADEAPLYDASVAANRKITLGNLFRVIDTFAAETSPDAADELALFDVTANTADKITLANFFKVIDTLTAKSSPAAADEVVIYDSSGTASKKATLAQIKTATAAFTTQYLTSGTGATYTTPANCRAIRVKMVGGGGGAAGGSASNGSPGGATTFNSVDANGGSGGINGGTSGNGGAGGSGGSGSASFRMRGNGGITAGSNMGGSGGAGVWGGAGVGGNFNTTAGTAGAANSGAGGGGGGRNGGAGGGGGGAGEYVELVIASPSASYTYTVGAGGNGGAAGGDGGTGLIIVEEYY